MNRVVKVPYEVWAQIRETRERQIEHELTKEEAEAKLQDLIFPFMKHKPNPSDTTTIEVDRAPQAQVPIKIV